MTAPRSSGRFAATLSATRQFNAVKVEAGVGRLLGGVLLALAGLAVIGLTLLRALAPGAAVSLVLALVSLGLGAALLVFAAFVGFGIAKTQQGLGVLMTALRDAVTLGRAAAPTAPPTAPPPTGPGSAG